MFAKCIALFLCLVGLPSITAAVVGTVQNAANLENFVVDTTGGPWMPVQYSQNQAQTPVNNLGPSGTTGDPMSNYFVLNPAYLGTDPLNSDLLRKQLLANSIATNTQLLPTTNQPPMPVQDPLLQKQSMPTPSATPTTNSIQEPPRQSGGMTFTVSSGPGTNLQTFGNPPLIIFAPQNPSPPLATTTATTSGIATVQPSVGSTNPFGSNPVNTPTVAPTAGTNPVNTPTGAPTTGTNPVNTPTGAPTAGTNPVNTPTTGTNPVNTPTGAPTTGTNPVNTPTGAPTTGTNPVNTPTVAPTVGTNPVNTPTGAPTTGTNPVNTPTGAPTAGTGTNTVVNPVQPTTAQPTPVNPAQPSTPSSIRNPFVPVTDPTFQFSGLPTTVNTLADPTKLNPLPEVTTSSPTFNDLTQMLTSTKNPSTVFELQTGMPWNQILNQPTPGPSVVVDPSAVNTPQTTTPTFRNPFLPANVPPFVGNPAPIDPQVISSSQPNAVGSGSSGTTNTGSAGSVISTSIPSTNVGSPTQNSASNTVGSATTVGPIANNIGTVTGTAPTSPTATGQGTSNIPAQTTQGTMGTQASGLPTATTTNAPGTSNTIPNSATQELNVSTTVAGTNETELLNATTGLIEVANGTELFNATGLIEVANGTELFNATGLTDLTNGTELFNVTEVSPLGTNETMNSTAAANVTTPAPPLVNPIDTILNLVANKTREPALQMSIDRQVGLFTKYLNQQKAYYQKSMDKLTALMDQVKKRNASTTSALTNIRGLLSGMITKPNQMVSLDNLLRAATTIQNLKDQVALAQSQKSISKIRSLIIDAARVANIGL